MDNDKIIYNESTTFPIKESDRFLIEYLTKKDTKEALNSWENKLKEEMFNKGYINKSNYYIKQIIKSLLFLFISPIVFMFITIFLAGFLYALVSIFDISYLLSIESENDFLRIIFDNNLYMILTSTVFSIIILLAITVLYSNLFKISYFITSILCGTKYERTDLGNQLSEKINAMKNFIHDFTRLSEAEKNSIIIWDEFLCYAIALEENESIIKEIKKTYKI